MNPQDIQTIKDIAVFVAVPAVAIIKEVLTNK